MHAPRMRSKQLEASDRNWQGSPCLLSVARIALWHLAVVWRHLAVARHLLPWQLLLLGLPGSERPSGGVEVKRRRARVHDEPGTMSVGTKSLSAMGNFVARKFSFRWRLWHIERRRACTRATWTDPGVGCRTEGERTMWTCATLRHEVTRGQNMVPGGVGFLSSPPFFYSAAVAR